MWFYFGENALQAGHFFCKKSNILHVHLRKYSTLLLHGWITRRVCVINFYYHTFITVWGPQSLGWNWLKIFTDAFCNQRTGKFQWNPFIIFELCECGKHTLFPLCLIGSENSSNQQQIRFLDKTTAQATDSYQFCLGWVLSLFSAAPSVCPQYTETF